MDIQLTSDERALFDLLLQAARPTSSVIRAAGGWARDKLLGRNPSDIDILVEDQSGEDFAKKVSAIVGGKSPHVIQLNPEKSKHVETAKAKIPLPSGVVTEVDFVRARQEVYGDQSRIPTSTSQATAQEDAFRRDLTVNAIFYNINAGKVEDFTGQGLTDLKDKILRSPGDPKKRFIEDPLRVIRVARFASQLGWGIDPVTFAAMADRDVLEALGRKTAQERVGPELFKLAAGEDPARGFDALMTCGAFDVLMARSLKNSGYENQLLPWSMDQNNPHHDLDLQTHTVGVIRNLSAMYPAGSVERAEASLMAAFHDTGKRFTGARQLRDDGYHSYIGHEDHSAEMAKSFLESVGLGPMTKKIVPWVALHMHPHNLARASGDKALRRLIRELAGTGLTWRDIVNTGKADAAAKGDPALTTSRLPEYDILADRLRGVSAQMEQLKIDPRGCILDGTEIMSAMGRSDPGPWIGVIKDWLKDLQDSRPDITKEEAAGVIREHFPEQVKTASANTDTKPAKKGNSSKILLDERARQVAELVPQRPQEAVSMAASLMGEYPDDKRAAFLCVETAIMAKRVAGADLVTDAICQISRKLARDDIYDVKASLLHVACKAILGRPMDDADKEAIDRANRLDPRITKRILGDFVG